VTLTPTQDGRARLVLEHVAYVDDDRWQQYGPGAVGVGWDLALMGLYIHLASGTAVDPGAVAAWSESDAGRQFVTSCSDDWGRASIAAGTPQDEALAAASRTTAFYTGAAEEAVDEPASS
jgi:hypothetical protein